MAATTLDSLDFASLLAQELLYQQLVSSLEGLHSGVPTRTTPTLTPTTLRTIEQTFLDFENESAKHSREAGFVPPLIEPSQPTPAQTHNNNNNSNNNNNNSNSNGLPTNLALHHNPHHQHQQQQHQIQPPPHLHQQHHQVQLHLEQQHQQQQQQQQQQQLSPPHQALTPPLHIQPQVQLQIQQTQLLQQGKTAKKNMGGRRPTRTIGMTPEEEERRQIRRERNKMAAARCRKRRMDHTNALLEETEGLEQKKLSLQDEISQLQQEKDDLEFMLEAHRPVCRLQSSSPPDVKPVITDNGKITLPSVDSQQQHLQQPEEFSDLPCNDSNTHNHNHTHNNNNNNNNNSSNSNNNHNGNSNGKQMQDGDSGSAVRLSRPNTLPIPTFTEPKPRPSSLQFKTVETPAFMKTMNEIAGIPITTPSTGIPFNYDSLMEGGTGLTPVSTPLVPSCSSQQRNNSLHQHHIQQQQSHHQQQQQQQHTTHHMGGAVDLSSPDANPKLVSL